MQLRPNPSTKPRKPEGLLQCCQRHVFRQACPASLGRVVVPPLQRKSARRVAGSVNHSHTHLPSSSEPPLSTIHCSDSASSIIPHPFRTKEPKPEGSSRPRTLYLPSFGWPESCITPVGHVSLNPSLRTSLDSCLSYHPPSHPPFPSPR